MKNYWMDKKKRREEINCEKIQSENMTDEDHDLEHFLKYEKKIHEQNEEYFKFWKETIRECKREYEERIKKQDCYTISYFRDALLIGFLDQPERGLLINASDPFQVKTVWKHEGQWRYFEAAIEIGCKQYVEAVEKIEYLLQHPKENYEKKPLKEYKMETEYVAHMKQYESRKRKDNCYTFMYCHDALLIFFLDQPERGVLINANDPFKCKTVWKHPSQFRWRLLDAAKEIGCKQYVEAVARGEGPYDMD